jgi:hypothetical protein
MRKIIYICSEGCGLSEEQSLEQKPSEYPGTLTDERRKIIYQVIFERTRITYEVIWGVFLTSYIFYLEMLKINNNA